jgi:hypothetical protein
MRKILLGIMFLCGSLCVQAHDFSALNQYGDSIYYNITSDSTVSVTYRGLTHLSYLDEYKGTVVVPEETMREGKKYKVSSIGRDAFMSCGSLTNMILPQNVKSISPYAFYFCYGLKSINLPAALDSIGAWSFAYCSSLNNVKFPNSLRYIGTSSFYYCIALSGSVDLINKMEVLSPYAFFCCRSIDNVNLGNSVTSIGMDAFRDCAKLSTIKLSDSLRTIGAEAFYDCFALSTVTIPQSVDSIGYWAFYFCSNLDSIKCFAKNPPFLDGVYVFEYVTKSIPLYVPCSSVSIYNSTKTWKAFTDIEPLIGSCDTTVASKTEIASLKIDDLGIEVKLGCIRSENESMSVYDIGGTQIYRGSVASGLKKGIYVVKIASSSVKVMVP